LVARKRREARLQVFPHGEQREYFAALRDVGDAAARPLGRPQARYVGAVESDRAARDRMLASERIEQARFADAVAAEHAGHLAGLRLERNRAQRLGGAVVKIESVDFQHADHSKKRIASSE